jgi:hypothetical protein
MLPTTWVRDLRHLLASQLSDAKAYDLPALCRGLGLADGTEQEAFSSKYKYANARLLELAAPRLVEIARSLLAEEPRYALAEIIHKYDEQDTPEITELTRRRIVALLECGPLATEIADIDLIRKCWPIADMPPHYETALAGRTLEQDIVQHTVNNFDWDNRQLLEALGILTCSRAQLFKFLASLVEPTVQKQARQVELVDAINQHLQHDGYALTVAGRISGSPRYAVTRRQIGSPADDAISATLAHFNGEVVHDRWRAALERRTSDPGGAITLARTLLEDVCKWILTDADAAYDDADDLPVLYRKLASVLNLAPDGHTEKVFKQILGNCQSVVESLGALRNKLSDAHSVGPKRARPLPRHAELAVNLSGAMATFLVSTWEARRRETGKPKLNRE